VFKLVGDHNQFVIISGTNGQVVRDDFALDEQSIKDLKLSFEASAIKNRNLLGEHFNDRTNH
jgi:hypothetical protein